MTYNTNPYNPPNYFSNELPNLTANANELSLANQYYNDGKMFGLWNKGWDVDKALQNGINPNTLVQAQYIKQFEANPLRDVGNIVNVGSQLANLYMGWRNYSMKNDLLKEQLKMAKEQHQMTMDEVNRVKKLRSNLAKFYRS
jgi:hypothetical protein